MKGVFLIFLWLVVFVSIHVALDLQPGGIVMGFFVFVAIALWRYSKLKPKYHKKEKICICQHCGEENVLTNNETISRFFVCDACKNNNTF